MKPLDRILAAVRARPRHIILPEGGDPRVAEAAARHVIDALSGRLPETAINPEVWSQTA